MLLVIFIGAALGCAGGYVTGYARGLHVSRVRWQGVANVLDASWRQTCDMLTSLNRELVAVVHAKQVEVETLMARLDQTAVPKERN